MADPIPFGAYCKPFETWYNVPGGDSVYVECLALIRVSYDPDGTKIDVTIRRYNDTYEGRYTEALFPKVWFSVKREGVWVNTPFDQIPDNTSEGTHAYGVSYDAYIWGTHQVEGVGVSFYKAPTTSTPGDGAKGELTHAVRFTSNGAEWMTGTYHIPDETRYVKINVPSVVSGHSFQDNGGLLLSIKDRNDGSFMITGVQYDPDHLVDANFILEHEPINESVQDELGSGWTFRPPLSHVQYSAFGGGGIGSILEGGITKDKLYCEWKSEAGYQRGELTFTKTFGDYRPEVSFNSKSMIRYQVGRDVSYLTVPLAIWQAADVAYIWDGYTLYTGSCSEEALSATYTPAEEACPYSYKKEGWPCFWPGLIGQGGYPVCTHDPFHYIETSLAKYPFSVTDSNDNPYDMRLLPTGYVELRGKNWPAESSVEFWVGVPVEVKSTEVRFSIERYTPIGEHIGTFRETGWISSVGSRYTNYDINGIMQHGFDRVPLKKAALSLHAAPSLPALAAYTREIWTVRGNLWNFARWPFEMPQRSAEKTGSMDQRSNKTQIVDYKDKFRTIWGLAQVKGTKLVPDPAYSEEEALIDPDYKLTPYLDPGFYLVPLGFEPLGEEDDIPPLKLKQRDDGRGLMANARLNRYSAEMASNGSIRLESGAYRV